MERRIPHVVWGNNPYLELVMSEFLNAVEQNLDRILEMIAGAVVMSAFIIRLLRDTWDDL